APAFSKATQLPRAKPGLRATPSSVAFRSVRGSPTRYTPPGIAAPVLPRALPTSACQAVSAAKAAAGNAARAAASAKLRTQDFMVGPPLVNQGEQRPPPSIELFGHLFECRSLQQRHLGRCAIVPQLRIDADRPGTWIGVDGGLGRG